MVIVVPPTSNEKPVGGRGSLNYLNSYVILVIQIVGLVVNVRIFEISMV